MNILSHYICLDVLAENKLLQNIFPSILIINFSKQCFVEDTNMICTCSLVSQRNSLLYNIYIYMLCMSHLSVYFIIYMFYMVRVAVEVIFLRQKV